MATVPFSKLNATTLGEALRQSIREEREERAREAQAEREAQAAQQAQAEREARPVIEGHERGDVYTVVDGGSIYTGELAGCAHREGGRLVPRHTDGATGPLSYLIEFPIEGGAKVMYSSVRVGEEAIVAVTRGGRTIYSRSVSTYPTRFVSAAEAEGEPEEGPTAWTGEATRIVTVKGKRYVVGTIVPARPRTEGAKSWIPRAYVSYWSERNGEAFGATRSTNGDAKPGTVGRAIWDAVNQ
ncbi:hypothetical protein [Streptomyces sp. NPDC101393]|uniref:hypothetical protein n=1 Tax=Streptomyces sp. NPDC101393 TaxID=3366141 RepID=UPI003807DEBA